MYSFYSFGQVLILYLGPLNFLTLYGFGGLVSSGCLLLVDKKFPHSWPSKRYCSRYNHYFGASGAINAMITYFTLLLPTSTMLLFFVIPIPAPLAWLAILSYDAYGLYYGGTGIGHGGHLGGAVFGAAYFFVTHHYRILRR